MPNPTKKDSFAGIPKDRAVKLFRKVKRKYYLKYRSAKTGKFVTKQYALKHLKTTVSEKVYL